MRDEVTTMTSMLSSSGRASALESCAETLVQQPASIAPPVAAISARRELPSRAVSMFSRCPVALVFVFI
jgi:hypothetical protein